MSNQLKLLLYIVFVVAIFWFVQSKFHIFDIKFGSVNQNETTQSEEKKDPSTTPENYVEIILGSNESVKVNIELANTESERQQGLSFRKYLGDYEGMLFVFNSEVNTSFWMKDMEIPLDIIFFDSQGFIVDMKEAQAPCTATYCPSIVSKKSYMYVLEVKSGFVEKNSISENGSLVQHIEILE